MANNCTPKKYFDLLKPGVGITHKFCITAPSNQELGPVDFSWDLPNGIIMSTVASVSTTNGTYIQGSTKWTNIYVDCGQTVCLEVVFEIVDDSKAPFKIDTTLSHQNCDSCDDNCYVEISGIPVSVLAECLGIDELDTFAVINQADDGTSATIGFPDGQTLTVCTDCTKTVDTDTTYTITGPIDGVYTLVDQDGNPAGTFTDTDTVSPPDVDTIYTLVDN